MNNEALQTFWYWIRERECVRVNRFNGIRPWTHDEIMAKHHFCNVRREDDRVTKELRAVVQSADLRFYQLPSTYTLARMLNHAPSLKCVLEGGWDALKMRRAEGHKIFHTAYVVSTCGKSMDKLDYVKGVVEAVGISRISTESLAMAHRDLMGVDGLGSFMAGQVVADLKNDRYLRDAWDWITWSSHGPGSIKGLGYIFGRSSPSLYEGQMAWLSELMPVEVMDMDLHAQDLQNCLCEFSKYWRIKNGLVGRVRPYRSEK